MSVASANLTRIALRKEAVYGVLDSEVNATLIKQDLTYTAVAQGESGNLISVAYTGGGTAGAEVVTVTGNAISIQIQTAVSTATQVRTAFNLSAAAVALASCAVSGTGSNAQVTSAAAFLTGGLGDFDTLRFVSESLSGSPNTVESKQIRTDRMSSGQVVTGLQVQGSTPFELAKEDVIDDLLESLMYSTWSSASLVTVNLDIDAAAGTLTRASGDFNSDLVVGDIVTLGGFPDSENNVPVQVTIIDSATVLHFAGPAGMITDATATGTTYQRADKISIGTTKKSFSMEKKFTDLSNKAVNYKGMIVSGMDLTIAHGEIVNGSFTFAGNGYEAVNAAADMLTYNRNVNSPATSQSLNGSVDMPFLASSATGTLGPSDFAIKSLGIKIDNNLSPQNAIGSIAPRDYSTGTCKIDIDISAYLDDDSWSLLANKLSQDPFAIGLLVKNSGGWYGFYIPAIQVSFDDPSAAGQNQDIMLGMKGMAKVGATGQSSITIYKSA